MSLVGVGIDVASIARIGRLLDRYGSRFESRWFDPAELHDQGNRRVALASSYAIKEAVWKALPHETPGPLRWRSIVPRVAPGTQQVVVDLCGPLAAEAASRGVTAISASVHVQGDVVLAIALVEGR